MKGLSEVLVHTIDDVYILMKKGLRNRIQRGTDYNTESSRSHALLQITINIEYVDEITQLLCMRKSTLTLVDLAGSEKWVMNIPEDGIARDNIGIAENAYETPLVDSSYGTLDVSQKEMVHINTSLHVLGILYMIKQ